MHSGIHLKEERSVCESRRAFRMATCNENVFMKSKHCSFVDDMRNLLTWQSLMLTTTQRMREKTMCALQKFASTFFWDFCFFSYSFLQNESNFFRCLCCLCVHGDFFVCMLKAKNLFVATFFFVHFTRILSTACNFSYALNAEHEHSSTF